MGSKFLASSWTSFQFCRPVDYCALVTFNKVYHVSKQLDVYFHILSVSSLLLQFSLVSSSISSMAPTLFESLYDWTPPPKHQHTNFLSSSVAYHTLAFTAVAFFNLYLSSAILIGMKGFITYSEGFVTILSPVAIRTNRNQRCAASRL